jgi:hypothetical protein
MVFFGILVFMAIGRIVGRRAIRRHGSGGHEVAPS